MADVSIGRIVGHIEQRPLLLPNKYMIQGIVANNRVWFNAHTVILPGKSLATADYFTQGPERKIPYQLINEDFTTVFYLTDGMQENKVFYDFMNKFGENLNGVMYYDDLVGPITVTVLDKAGDPQSVIEIVDAYPTGISSVDLNYNAEAISEVTVTWTAYNFSSKDMKE